jgi:hypothetical protein
MYRVIFKFLFGNWPLTSSIQYFQQTNKTFHYEFLCLILKRHSY